MDLGAELKGKVGPFPLYVWLLIMTGIGVAAWLLLKKNKSATPTSGTPGTPCTMTDGSAGTWDSTGTVCQATTVSTVNADNGSGQGRGWRAQSTLATATTTPAATAATSAGTTAAAATVPPASTPVTTAGTTKATSPAGPPPQPGGVHQTAVTTTSIAIAWTRAAGATSYRIRVTYQSALVKQQTATGTAATITGLTPDHTYGVHVASVGPGGTSAEGDVNIKTAK